MRIDLSWLAWQNWSLIARLMAGITRSLARRSEAPDYIQVARKQGMLTLREDGLIKVEKGITTIEEVLRETAIAD